MELIQKLNDLSERLTLLKENIHTEEATKQSMILPFFQALGYDVFNPLEFIPEYTADVGIKKGEKVDYAIMQDDKPLILIEAKSCNETLDKHSSQLYRYFGTTEAKFGILTNGLVYRFYSDLDEINKMDSMPFYVLDLENLNEQSITYLEGFIKDNLDVNNILANANNLKYMSLIKQSFKALLNDPSDDFVKLILNTGVYDGVKNQKIIDKFRPIIQKAINQSINEKLTSKFNATLNQSGSSDTVNEDIIEIEDEKIVTTAEELDSFAIVKSILRKYIPVERVLYKDTESYFGILLDGNTRKWIIRINLNTSKHHIFLPDENKKPMRFDINTIDDIYNYEKELAEIVSRYDN